MDKYLTFAYGMLENCNRYYWFAGVGLTYCQSTYICAQFCHYNWLANRISQSPCKYLQLLRQHTYTNPKNM